jgi:hypothetical protein
MSSAVCINFYDQENGEIFYEVTVVDKDGDTRTPYMAWISKEAIETSQDWAIERLIGSRIVRALSEGGLINEQ